MPSDKKLVTFNLTYELYSAMTKARGTQKQSDFLREAITEMCKQRGVQAKNNMPQHGGYRMTGFWYSDSDRFFGTPQFSKTIEETYACDPYSDEDYSEYVDLETYSEEWEWLDSDDVQERGERFLDEANEYCFDDDILEFIHQQF